MLKEILSDMPRPYIKYLPQVNSAKGGEHNGAGIQGCVLGCLPVCAVSSAALGPVLALGQWTEL